MEAKRLIAAGCFAVLSANAAEYIFKESTQAALSVDISTRTKEAVSPFLFGKFSEHVGRNVYGGLWAETIENPGMDSFWKVVRRSVLTLNELKKTNRKTLVAAIEKNLPYLWYPLGDTSAVYSFATNAPYSKPDAAVCTLSQDTSQLTGFRQTIALPAHRCANYKLTLHLRCQGKKLIPVQVQVANAGNGNIVLDKTVATLEKQWERYDFNFSIRKSKGKKPVFFNVCIGTRSRGAFAVDSVSLMPADNLRGWCPESIRLIRKAQCPLMRFPGGNFVSGYHWKNGIGPPFRRTALPNPAWSGLLESNRVGTHEWMDFMELTGCEPLLCINAGNGTPQEALEWLEYLNGDASTPMGKLRAKNGHPKPWNVRYVEIGNELFGSWQIGHCNAREYAQRYKAFYSLLSKHYPNIRYIANGGPKHNLSWNEELLRTNRADVRCISIHYLFDQQAAHRMQPEPFYWLSMAQAWGVEQELKRQQKLFSRYSPDCRIAVTELMLFPQVGHLVYPSAKTLSETLWYSGFINSCMRKGDFVELITYSASMNHGASLQKKNQRIYSTPGWLAYTFYSTAEGRHPCSFELKTPFFKTPEGFKHAATKKAPLLDAFCLATPDGRIANLFIANRSINQSFRLPISIKGGTFKHAFMETITGDNFLDQNSPRQPDKITVQKTGLKPSHPLNITLPRLSLVRITFR